MNKVLVISIFTLFIAGCGKNFLDRLPVTKNVVQDFYKTPSDAADALTAVYNVLTYEDTDPINLLSEIASDDCFGGGGASDGDGLARYDRFIPQIGDNVNQNLWQEYYTAIYRANVLLENIGSVNWGSDTTLKTQYTAEDRFLRAYFYFNLTRLFGQVPLILHTITPGENTPAATAEDIFKAIAQDLMFAANSLPAIKYQNMDPTQYGHATKWAAEAMLGRVFLYYTGYWSQPDIGGIVTRQQVATYIDDVINSSGHSLVTNFASLWLVPAASTGVTYAGEGNSESVFAIKYDIVNKSNQQHGANWWSRMIGPRSYNVPPYGQGWGAATVNPHLWNDFDAADTIRRNASILSWAREKLTYTNVGDQRQYTGFNAKKYENLSTVAGQPEDVTLGSTNWQYDGYEDFMDMRLADVLLMGAELHLSDNVVLANTYINLVRTRGFGNSNHAVTLTGNDATSQQLIFQERRFELAFEGQRYWDLMRQCSNPNNNFAPLVQALTTTDPNGLSPQDLNSQTVDGNNAAAVKGLFQIPPVEIRLMNNVIHQNTGY